MSPNTDLLLAGAGFVLLALAAAVLLAGAVRREARLQQRVQGLRSAPGAKQRGGLTLNGSLAAVGHFAVRHGLLPAGTLTEMQDTLVSLGLPGRDSLALFVGTKLVFLMGAPLLAYLACEGVGLSAPMNRLLPAMAAAIGLVLPDMIVRRLRKRYLQQVERGLPDSLDMLILCAQAGLGLEPALLRVSQEIALVYPEMAREWRQTLDEMRISVDRRSALESLAGRTKLDTIKRVMSTLAQAMQYGTPLTDSLRTLSAEMRQLLLTRYEEKSARLPVLLTLPMIVFIFPCVLIVIGGPAVLHIMQTFNS